MKKSLYLLLLLITGLLIGTAAHAATPVFTKRVAVIEWNPKNPNDPNERLFQHLNWPDPKVMTTKMIDTISRATAGRVQYVVDNTYVLDDFPQKVGGGVWTWESYNQCYYTTVPNRFPEGECTPGVGNYYPLVTQLTGQNLCEQVRSGQIDEIWVWGIYYDGLDEFAYKIPGDATFYDSKTNNGWLYNLRKNDLPECGRPYFVMGFVPEAGMGNSLHSYGHRVESALSLSPPGQGYFAACSETSVNPAVTNEWTRFVCYDKASPGRAACGDVHEPPNALQGYDYGLTRTVNSSCDDWKNYPTLTGATKPVNYLTWEPTAASPLAGDTQAGFMEWWLSHIPHFDGSHTDTNGTIISNDWWNYILNYQDPFASSQKKYAQVYLRGTNNNWTTTTKMTLVRHNTWQATVIFGNTSSERFKFDINGDWSLNFGDNNRDMIADKGGADIYITSPGQYIITFNDISNAYTVTKDPAFNLPPVANAGADQTINGAPARITIDASASRDPDGSITSYNWEQYMYGGWIGIQSGNPFVQDGAGVGTYRYRLTAYDNQGASSQDEVTVTVNYARVYNTVYLRGTNNAWATTTPMTLTGNNTWQVTATFGSATNERFKFDINANWALNFGDQNADFIADQNGADIAIRNGAGTYLISFNDQTRRYTIVKQ